ncbi:cAMP-binding domain of CRP or a regulatory subunit of cAMP-dependent protein kinases [Noviherbaspirillum humi]|uniref:cAMP-binding domain of CRP or a regulatory subunit of cAMP-dependent protein kinases n=1 Tax=Noviherbaspirillum humi TaxID=1688639 RepID=A0A239I4Q6_9BURK|nr:Crp/Fnr family transcriptional regulator [Noviherbaspirillum humi]SNS88605.1 cAMP-binding domain of CRP or a regulatory subunit of cAMP-dependent protein kinases [Noviherbaspirillum humi]
MSVIPSSPAECANLLLSMLPDADYQALLPYLELIDTPIDFMFFRRDQPIRHAYFPLRGAHSVLATMEDGSMVEIATVGYEGFSTVDLLLGSRLATETMVCQMPGAALSLPAAVFQQMTDGDTPLRRLCMRYLQAYLCQISQSVACNRLHDLQNRLARWLLISHDRAQQAELPLTQAYLAVMLGVQRPSVSFAATSLQRAGLIECRRGVIRILDRKGLEAVSCECYATVKRQFHRFLGKDG